MNINSLLRDVPGYGNIPAFGFETTKCNSRYRHLIVKFKPVAEKVFKQASNGSPIDLNNPEFVSFVTMSRDNMQSMAQKAWKTANIVKALGYIPLVGMLIGVNRIVKAARMESELLPNKYEHIARGCIEALSLGALFIIPDIALTIFREYNAKPEAKCAFGMA